MVDKEANEKGSWEIIEGQLNLLSDDVEREGLLVVASNNKYLDDLPLLPAIEEDRFHNAKKAWEKAKKQMEDIGESVTLEQKAWFVSGYTAATKKYTEEDILKLLEQIREHDNFYELMDNDKMKSYITSYTTQYLNPLPKQVEVEMETVNDLPADEQIYYDGPLPRLKVANNFIIVKRWIWQAQ